MSHGARCLVFVLVAVGSASAQEHWSQTFGGDSRERLLDLVEADDGTFLVAAVTDSFGTERAEGWLVRFDRDGTVVSEHSQGNLLIGGAQGAVVSPDGTALFTGRHVIEFFSVHHGWLLKADAEGRRLWSLNFSTASGRHSLLTADVTINGGYVAGGDFTATDASPAEAWLVGVSTDGIVEWQRRYQSTAGEVVRALESTSDLGQVVAGCTTDTRSGLTDAWLMKTRVDGSIAWQWALGGSDQDDATDVTQAVDGGFAACGWTDSVTSSRHAPWLARFDASGALLWSVVYGDAEWGDFQDVEQRADGSLLLTGRIQEVGFPTSDLWIVEASLADGSLTWQRAYESPLGDDATTSSELADGELLVGGVWGSGLPEESLWVLRTGADGRIDPCSLLRDTTVVPNALGLTVREAMAAEVPPSAMVDTVTFLTTVTGTPVDTQCFVVPACEPLTCAEVVVAPDPSCAGEEQALSVTLRGGEAPFTVEWDLDGDTLVDETGESVVVTLPVGAGPITVTVTDSCDSPGPQSCTLDVTPTVAPSDPPGEVSDVTAGEPPLLVGVGGATLTVEQVAEATAYHVYADRLGSWYFPTAASGGRCSITTWTELGDGTLRFDDVTPVGSWLVVTAATSCAEGSPGQDSAGTPRESVGAWERCGAGP
ncbi:MAG: hypothetical protein AAF533_09420 [Acidobacteriota bacterium]